MDYKIIHMLGDGNCLFRCFSFKLFGVQDSHRTVRVRIVQFVDQNWDIFKPFIVGNIHYNVNLDGIEKSIQEKLDYVNYMSKDGVYGTDVEIEVFSRMYGMNVFVHLENSNVVLPFVNVDNQDNLRMIFHGNYDSGHYNLIVLNNFNEPSVNNKSKRKCGYESKKSNMSRKKKRMRIKSPKNKKTNDHPKEVLYGFEKSQAYESAMNDFRLNELQCNFGSKRSKASKTLCSHSDFGEMDYECPHCGAVFWGDEKKKTNCCHNGTISLSPLSHYDEQLKELIKCDECFRYFIRYYNHMFSFATWSAKVRSEKTKAIFNLKIQGQVCHIAPNSLIPKKDEEPRCGQLYIYDNDTALKKRLALNENLTHHHTKILTSIMNKNPYSKRYKHLNYVSHIQKIPNYKLYFLRKNGKQRHTYNKPLTSECGAILVSKSGIPEDFDMCVYPKNQECPCEQTYLNKLSHHVDPMTFPIFFPSGDLGWSTGYEKNPDCCTSRSPKDRDLSILQYYSYRLSYRPHSNNFSPLLYGGRLTQQYFIHSYVMIENNRMNFFRKHQSQLRIECYQGLIDAVKNSALNISENFESKERLGNLFVLPSTYIGGPRYMQQHYQDAMAIMRNVGRPDLFITMTCNPKWKELKKVLKKFPPRTTPNDIPNITVRLFKMKMDELIKDVMDKDLFGKAIGCVWTVEFQKRGLPHIHLLVTLHPNNKLLTTEGIDQYISAEIPSDSDKELQKLVIKHMLHGPHTKKSPCLNEESKTCKKNFPKQFRESTNIKKDGYPEYKRSNNTAEGHIYKNKSTSQCINVDNSMVVPYNPFLLKKYRCHINVEYCASIQSIKYVFDYLHKGSDRAFCKLKRTDGVESSCEIRDELSDFIEGRYLSPMECAWRIQEFPLCGRSHSVERLAVHVENQQSIVFRENREEEALKKWRTTLTEWFELNKRDEFARKLKYINIPKYYRFDNVQKIWIKRSRSQKFQTIGRMSVVSPKDSERFYLKLILNRVKGATSYEDLRTFEGRTYDCYRETARAMGMIEDDEQINKIFEEACTIMFPNQLRKFFCWFLLSENIQGTTIWEKFKPYFIQDFEEDGENKALQNIKHMLEIEDMSLESYGLPQPEVDVLENSDILSDLPVEECEKKFLEMHEMLNEEQKLIFDELTNVKSGAYFIDGPGGSGKTFLYKTLIFFFLSKKIKILSMAWTGIASILLPKGMTSHRQFKLPIEFQDIETIFLKSDSDKKRLREADIIIWDEASMIPKKALEIVERTLRDLCNNDLPFGGKLIILGGDFRQILPVMKKFHKDSIVEETIKYSSLWGLFKIMKLTQNLRSNNTEFSSFLLNIGEGKIDRLTIPQEWKCDDVCGKIYGNSKRDRTINSVILAPHNEDTLRLNKKILSFEEGSSTTYYSIDYATHKDVDQTDDNIHLDYPIEVLNNIREGLPPHELELKVNAIVMLIRNLSVSDGLCNGTRLRIVRLYKYNIEAEIITGDKMGSIVFIPRITLDTKNSSLPFTLYRKQFPLVLAFAMTINKSQGQSFDMVGLYLRRPLFSHGQLYVALSRCRNPNNLYIENHLEDHDSIENIVWKEIFEI